MSIDDIAQAIVRLPRTLDERKSSLSALLRETGYFEAHEAISVEMLKKVVTERAENIDDWLGYSADKRTSQGPYLTRKAGQFIVGHLGSPGGAEEYFNDPTEATARFIKAEIESVRR